MPNNESSAYKGKSRDRQKDYNWETEWVKATCVSVWPKGRISKSELKADTTKNAERIWEFTVPRKESEWREGEGEVVVGGWDQRGFSTVKKYFMKYFDISTHSRSPHHCTQTKLPTQLHHNTPYHDFPLLRSKQYYGNHNLPLFNTTCHFFTLQCSIQLQT